MKTALTFAFIIAVAIYGCKEETETPPNSPFFVKVFFSNGDSISIRDGALGTNGYGRGGGVIDSTGTYFEYQSTSFAGGGDKITILFMKTFPSEPSSPDRENIFYEGNYDFGSSVIDSLKDGVEVILEDSAGQIWRTAYGMQTGSFTVTEHSENTFDNFTPFMTSGSFTCRLFDSTGNFLSINAAIFRGRTVVYP